MFNKISITMEKYMFIFLGGDPSHLSPEAQQAHMQKWFTWVEKLTNEKRYVAGEALLPGGKTITGLKKVVTDGPFAESKEVVGGFFVVLAKTIDEAIQIAKDCPDYDLGGIVEVREVMKMDM
jgi:hypothetical protein